MKKFIPLLVILFLLSIIAAVFISLGKQQQMIVVFEDNTSRYPVSMSPGKFQDSECGMTINDLDFASQVVASDGKTWFFDDHGCMAAWLAARPFKDDAVIWVTDLSTGAWIDGRTAWYSRTEESPMNYGFGAYSNWTRGRVDFHSMQELMLRGETMADLKVRQRLLGE